MTIKQKPIEWRAIMAAGAPRRVAEHTGYHEITVRKWATGKPIAADAVTTICRLGQGMFQPHQLRPDVFDESQRVEVTA